MTRKEHLLNKLPKIEYDLPLKDLNLILEAMEAHTDEQLSSSSVMHPLPNWYKTISLLELQMKALQEDLPRNLKNKKGDFKDLESFDMLLTAMRGKLNRVFKDRKES
jgi:hypothetical protein